MERPLNQKRHWTEFRDEIRNQAVINVLIDLQYIGATADLANELLMVWLKHREFIFENDVPDQGQSETVRRAFNMAFPKPFETRGF